MLAECARVLMRRWLRAVLALIVAVGLGVATYEVIAPGQESSAQVLILPSIKQPGVTGPTNPFVSLNGSISIVASVVQVGVSDQRTAAALESEGARAKYTVVPNLAENAGPVLLITVDDKSAAMTQKTLAAVIRQVSSQLLKIQKDKKVDPDLYITSMLLTASDRPLPVHKSQVQKAAIAFFGSFVIFVAAILLLERSTMRRRPADEEPTETTSEATDLGVDPTATTTARRGSSRRSGRTHGAAPGTGRSGSGGARRGASGKQYSSDGARSRRAKRTGGDVRRSPELVPTSPAEREPRLAVSNLARLKERHDNKPGSHALASSDHSE